MAISPDGKRLVFEQQTPAFSFDLMMLSLMGPFQLRSMSVRQGVTRVRTATTACARSAMR